MPSTVTERPGRALFAVTAAQVLAVASTTVIAVALPAIGRDLDADGAELQWIVDSFVLVFAALLVAAGVLGDRRGRRDAFLAGLVLFAAGSLWCALAPGVPSMLAGRVLQAVGPALVLPASLAIVTMSYPDPLARARAVGIWAVGSGIGLALGPLAGGLLVDGLGWRWIFGVNVPICLGLALLALRSVPRDRPERPAHPFDGAAAVALTAGLALLVFAVIEGRSLGWGSPPIVGALAASAVLGAAFVRREGRHPAPLVDLALLRQRPFLAANVAGAILFGTLTASSIYVSVFLQQVQGHSALEAGLCLLPQGVLVAMFGPVAGRVTGRRGPRLPILAGLALCCVSYVAFAGVGADTPIWQISAIFALLGVVGGIGLPPMTVTAMSAAPAEQVGMASAVHAAGRQLGQTLGVAILGTVIYVVAGHDAAGDRLHGAAAESWLDGLRVAMFVSAAAVLVAAAVTAALVPRGPRRVRRTR